MLTEDQTVLHLLVLKWPKNFSTYWAIQKSNPKQKQGLYIPGIVENFTSTYDLKTYHCFCIFSSLSLVHNNIKWKNHHKISESQNNNNNILRQKSEQKFQDRGGGNSINISHVIFKPHLQTHKSDTHPHTQTERHTDTHSHPQTHKLIHKKTNTHKLIHRHRHTQTHTVQENSITKKKEQRNPKMKYRKGKGKVSVKAVRLIVNNKA